VHPLRSPGGGIRLYYGAKYPPRRRSGSRLIFHVADKTHRRKLETRSRSNVSEIERISNRGTISIPTSSHFAVCNVHVHVKPADDYRCSSSAFERERRPWNKKGARERKPEENTERASERERHYACNESKFDKFDKESLNRAFDPTPTGSGMSEKREKRLYAAYVNFFASPPSSAGPFINNDTRGPSERY